MTKKNYEEIKNWMENQYGVQPERIINYGETKIAGILYGDDECFEGDVFFQYFLTDKKLYKVFYEIPEDEDLENINYKNPYKIEEEDVEYWVDYVI